MTFNEDWGGPPGRRSRTLWSDIGGLWRSFRSRGLGVQLLAAAVVVVLILVLLASRGDDGGSERVASRSSTTRPTVSTSTTSTTVVLPPGDDGVVRTVLDGDSFELDNGTKVRMIGIDAPDVETDACFSGDATTHLRQLLPAGTSVRLAYDQTRTDRLDRTLAYVYRIPDGLFVNVAMVRDGFATELRTLPNTLHADEIGAAANEARTANRGLHQVCSTTTTSAARTTTTAARATTTAAPGTTTTTAADEPTTTSSTVAATTSSVATVPRDGVCLTEGATAVFSDGAAAVCSRATDGFLRWRAA
ncbi:MAG: thermonuclease family protein [Acidimicrobiia bacterium]